MLIVLRTVFSRLRLGFPVDEVVLRVGMFGVDETCGVEVRGGRGDADGVRNFEGICEVGGIFDGVSAGTGRLFRVLMEGIGGRAAVGGSMAEGDG